MVIASPGSIVAGAIANNVIVMGSGVDVFLGRGDAIGLGVTSIDCGDEAGVVVGPMVDAGVIDASVSVVIGGRVAVSGMDVAVAVGVAVGARQLMSKQALIRIKNVTIEARILVF